MGVSGKECTAWIGGVSPGMHRPRARVPHKVIRANLANHTSIIAGKIPTNYKEMQPLYTRTSPPQRHNSQHIPTQSCTTGVHEGVLLSQGTG